MPSSSIYSPTHMHCPKTDYVRSRTHFAVRGHVDSPCVAVAVDDATPYCTLASSCTQTCGALSNPGRRRCSPTSKGRRLCLNQNTFRGLSEGAGRSIAVSRMINMAVGLLTFLCCGIIIGSVLTNVDIFDLQVHLLLLSRLLRPLKEAQSTPHASFAVMSELWRRQ